MTTNAKQNPVQSPFILLRESSDETKIPEIISLDDDIASLDIVELDQIVSVFEEMLDNQLTWFLFEGRFLLIKGYVENLGFYPRFPLLEGILPFAIFEFCGARTQEMHFSAMFSVGGSSNSFSSFKTSYGDRFRIDQSCSTARRETIICRAWRETPQYFEVISIEVFECRYDVQPITEYHKVFGRKEDIDLVRRDEVFRSQSGRPSRKVCHTGESHRTPDNSPDRGRVISPKAQAARERGISPSDFEKRKKAKFLDKTRRRDIKFRKEMAGFKFQGFADLLRGVVNVHPDVAETLDDFRDHAEKISDQVPKMTQLFAKLEQDGLQVNVGLDKSMIHVPAVAGMFALTYMATIHRGKWVYAAGAFGVVYAGSCAFQHRSFLIEKFTKIFSRERADFKSQSFDISMIEDLSAAVIGYMSVLSCKNVKGKSAQISAFVKSLSQFDRAKSGLSAAVTFGIGVVTRIINWFREEFLGLGAISLVASAIPELEAWTAKVTIIHDEAHAGVLAVNTENSARLHALISEGAALVSKKFSVSDSRQVSMCVGVYMGILRKLVAPFDSANLTSDGCRMEPVIILFTGAPGVGKTWAMMPVLLEVMKRILPPEQHAAFLKNYRDFIFCRFPETKYWEGYRRQLACLFDDFGQARDAAGQPDNEYLELIRAGNIFPYLLHMAGIDAKANTTFQSRLIFCTSNQKNFEPQSIVEKEAVMRRFNLIVEVAPKPEYCVKSDVAFEHRRLNKQHPDIARGSFNPDIYEFQLKEQVKGIVSQLPIATLTYSELIDRIVSLYATSAARADDYLKYLDDLVKNLAVPEEKVRFQSAHSVDMSELHSLEREFDSAHVNRKSKMNLDELLNIREDPNELMSRADFFFWMVREETQATWFKRLQSPKRKGVMEVNVAAYNAYRINPSAFMQCYEEHRDRLRDLVDVLVDDDVSYVTIDSNSILERKKAAATLSSYGTLIKDKAGSLLDAYSWLPMWQQAAVALGGAWTLARVTGLHDWINSLVTPSEKKEKEKEPLAMGDDVYFPPQPGYPGLFMESGGPRERNVKFVVKRPKEATVLRSEGGKDLNAHEMLKSAIRHSQYLLTIPDRNYKVGYINFLSGRHALCPNHFIVMLKVLIAEGDGEASVYIWNCVSKVRFKTSVREFVEGHVLETDLAMSDLAIVHIPQAHLHRDNTRYFVTDKQLAGHSVLPGILAALNDDEECPGMSSHVVPLQRTESQVIECYDQLFTVTNLLRYNAPTMEGDCGMLIIANLAGFGPGKMMGIHVAGSQNMVGIGSVVTLERLLKALSMSDHPCLPTPTHDSNFVSQCGEMPFPGNFEMIGETTKFISQPGRTSIVRSEFHNLWTTSPKAPACLRPIEVDGEVKNPMVEAICRYGNEKPWVDVRPLKLAADYICSRTLKFTEGHYNNKPTVFSFEDAVLGVPSMRYCNSVPRTTSAGFPTVLNPRTGFRGKEQFFGKEPEYDLTRPECIALKKECEEIISSARQGKRSVVVYMDVLKDELRKKERVRTANTRLISAAPIAYTIVCRMFFLSWVMAIVANNLHVGIGVGMNCYSSDWDVLVKGLLSISNARNCLAGDFTGYDTSHIRQIAEFVLAIIQAWYRNQEDALVREVLFADLTTSIHVMGNLIYLWMSGNLPSGHPLTAVFSSFMTLILYVAAWIKLNPKGLGGISDFHKHVYIVSYGDDSIVSVSDYAVEFFNYHTISVVMKEFGYNYTDEMKTTTGEGPKSRPLNEVNFLKRGFRYEEAVGRYVAPLAMESILEMLYWTKRGANRHRITCDNVDHALRELSLHSQQDFQLWAPKVVEAAREYLEYHPAVVDYRALQSMTCNLDNIW